jgi:hypothetical protein
VSKCTSSVLYINSLISYLYPVHLYVIQDYVFFLNGIFYRICIELFQLLYFSLRRWRFGHMEQTVFMYRGEASWQAQLKKVLPDTRLDNEWGNWYSKRIRGGLWCLPPLSTIFQLYCGGQFYCGGNRRTRRKPLTCRKSLTNWKGW